MMAEDTIQLMDYLNVKEAHLVGVSMGGLIVQENSHQVPERVVKIESWHPPGLIRTTTPMNNARHVRGR